MRFPILSLSTEKIVILKAYHFWFLSSLIRFADFERTRSSRKFSFWCGIIIALNYWSKLAEKGGPAYTEPPGCACFNSFRGGTFDQSLVREGFPKKLGETHRRVSFYSIASMKDIFAEKEAYFKSYLLRFALAGVYQLFYR